MPNDSAGLNLGKLESVDVRQVWSREAGDFTPWLAQESNIKLLGEAIGIELEVEAQEKSVGPFRADILCKNVSTDNWVLIENQLERTDHTHLGQLLTYAAGLDAVTIIWISPYFTEEHRATLDWLNVITNESFNFFGLEIEAWRIGDSPIAPKFNIISKPNDWTKKVAEGARILQTTELTETKQLQLRYWGAFKEFVEARSNLLRPQKPLPQHWTNFAIGRSGFYINALVNTVGKRIVVGLVINHPSAKAHFKLLFDQRTEIEAEIGSSLTWLEMPNYKESRVEVYKEKTDPFNESDWPSQHQWLLENLEKFRKAFSQRARSLMLPESNGG
jgi:hypothetical protein